jgi:hypothetical protein
MEGLRMTNDEDISATMMRRSRCHDVARYSMDTASNIRMLSEERPIGNPSPLEPSPSSTRYSLLRLWSWIDRVEALCNDGEEPDEEFGWPARGLMDAGVLHLLTGVNDQPMFSDSLSIDMFNSPARR